jgi:hypothetical protein
MRGAAGTTREIEVEFSLPIRQRVGESTLRIDLPRAVTSQLRLTLDAPFAEVRLIPDIGLIETAGAAADPREIVASGIGGQTELAWRPVPRSGAAGQSRLDAEGEIFAQVEGTAVRWDARLTVQSFGGAFDHFRVRLPPGAELTSTGEPGYRLSLAAENAEENADPADADPPEGPWVDVTLDFRTVGPTTVRLTAERRAWSGGERREMSLEGFEVLGAASQFGHVAVEGIGNWRLQWRGQQFVQQVEMIPTALEGKRISAIFEYSRQPFALSVLPVPRERRVRVEPQYTVLVGPDRAELEAKLKYTIRGNRANQFEIDLAGWEVELDSVGPANVVDIDAVTTADGVLYAPLRQPATGQFELEFRAFRPTLGPDDHVDLALPRPRADSRTQSLVAIVPDDNVEIAPLSEETVGMSPQQSAPFEGSPVRRRTPLYYVGEIDEARFVAEMKVHEQSVHVDVDSRIQLTDRAARIEQTLKYRVEYVPLENLKLVLPPGPPTAGLSVSLDGQRLAPAPLHDPDADATDAANQGGVLGAADGGEGDSVLIPLLEPRIGVFSLRVEYTLDDARLAPRETAGLSVGLVMPADGILDRNSVAASAPQGVQLSPVGDEWTVSETPTVSTDKPAELRLTRSQRASLVPLTAAFADQRTLESTVVHQAWIQSLLTDAARQDRLVVRITTSESAFSLTLPPGADPENIECYLNGQPAAAVVRDAGRLTVPIPATSQGQRHVIDLRYRTPFGLSAPGELALDPPEFSRENWVQRVYWQVVLPNQRHVVNTPHGYAGEFTWRWSGWRWGRAPLWKQSDLEDWAGAGRFVDVPATSNQYLFSSLGSVAPLRLRVASRLWIVLAASSAALLVGMALIHLPRLRRPEVLLLGVVALAAGAAISPQLAAILLQASLLGVLLVVLSGVLRRLLARPKKVQTIFGTVGGMASSRRTIIAPPTLSSRSDSQVAQPLQTSESRS